MAKNKKLDKDVVCQKNDELTLDIVDMGTEGEGIGRIDGYTLFVKDAIVGDKVRVVVMKTKKRFGYARLLQIIEPSQYRVEPACKVARQCGGCQLQHCSYEKQSEWKADKVKNCLERIGGFENITMEPILKMEEPYQYRNKAQFPIGTDKEGKLVAGFYACRTHSIIENTDCNIQHPCNHEIVETILKFMKDCGISAYNETTHTGLVRHILTRVGVKTGEVMVCLVINGKKLPCADKLVEMLLQCNLEENAQETPVLKSGQEPMDSEEEKSCETKASISTNSVDKLRIKSICLNENTQKTNVILGDKTEVLYGEGYIEDYIGDIKYRISPLSFYQVNPLQTKRLYDTALEYADLKGGEVVWDLYCGIGTISLFLAQKAAKVCGVEIVPQAIADAKENAKLNHMDNTEFFVGAAENVVTEQYEKSGGKLKADVVTLDPPRKGCDEKLLQTVIQMEPGRIVYVSCDPATLARDLRYLCDRGYALKRVRACDMFPQSFHIETCCLLVKDENFKGENSIYL